MNLNMTRPKDETEDLLVSITENCETLIDQTQTQPQKTIEFKLTKPSKTFPFKPPIQIKRSWITGLISLEVNDSIFIIKEEKNNFEPIIQILLISSLSQNHKKNSMTSLVFQILHHLNYSMK